MPKMLSYDQYTILAPTDAAFGKIAKDKLDALYANPDLLAEVVYLHFLPGKLLKFADFSKMAPVTKVRRAVHPLMVTRICAAGRCSSSR